MEFAQSAVAALQRISDIRGAPLILILSDINMPGMSGLELLPKARAARPDVPVIMITAYGDDDTKRKALEGGAKSLLTKPIDFATLARRDRSTARASRMSAKILVVDDEPDLEGLILQKFRRQIRDGSVSFLFARDGVEALTMLDGNRDVDMVLSDINMPRMDGLSLLGKLQESDDNLSTVIVSAYGDMANIRTAMNRGAFDFVTKPIDFVDLETTIAKTIRHVGILREARRRQLAAERAHASLSRYFSPNLAERLASDGQTIDLGGQRREIATLFTDITGFTTLVETLDPEVLEPLLNDYLAGMTEVVFAHDGTVAKIVGDALARAVRRAGRAARPCDAGGHVLARARRVRARVPPGLERPRGCLGGDADRRSCRTGDRRQFRRQPLLRVHGLRRHHQRRCSSRVGEQAARHVDLRQRRCRGTGRGLSSAAPSAISC